MSLLITDASVEEAALDILNKGYAKKLNVTTIKGKTSCKTKKDLINFMILQVLNIELVEVSEGECECLKKEFSLTQDCAPPAETFYRIVQDGNIRVDGNGNYRIYQ